MNRRAKYSVELLSIGSIISELHYGLFAREWWFTSNIEPVDVKDGDSFIPGFSCKCEEISGKIYNNPTSAISSLYQRLFETTTKFSDRLNIFVYSIGISDNSCLLSAGSGFNSSFISVIKKNGKAKSPVITQGIEKTGCFINIYVDNQLFKRIEGVDPNQTWKQTGLLKQYEGNALFGLNHYRSQERLAEAKKLYCPPGEWRIR
ncbi:7558_t:CDS:2 [Gigaspora rosea]|nr:7558_t:CDS:2 [Gigaspora rosea]